MMPDVPTLGIQFDIDKILNEIDSAAYGLECWRVFWGAVNPEEMAGAQLFEGDTGATLAGTQRVYCIGIQSTDRSTLGAIRAALKDYDSFDRVAATHPFVEGDLLAGEPLVHAGKVDHAGNLVGESPRARPALGEVRRERSGGKVTGPVVEPIPARGRPSSPRTASLPKLSSVKELTDFLKENFYPEPEKACRPTEFFVTPEELCDIVEHYVDFVQAQWETGSRPYAEEVIDITLFNKRKYESTRLYLRGMFTFSSKADARAYCYDKTKHLDHLIGRLEELMHVEGLVSLNFIGNGAGSPESYRKSYRADKKSEKNVSPEELWRMIFARGRALGFAFPAAPEVEGAR